MPTFGSLFAGIGGIDLGLERAGWTCRRPDLRAAPYHWRMPRAVQVKVERVKP